MDTLRRSLQEPLVRALKQFRVVAVVGARQVGKSTIVRTLPDRHYVTLDDLGALSAAAADPHGFVERLPIPATIDEVQRVPELLLAIKAAVDHERRPGAFLITGSSRLDTLRGIRESLAGRVALLTLRPMTHLELSGAPDSDPIGRLFECADVKGVVSHFSAIGLGRLDVARAVLAGGFPEPAIHLEGRERGAWFREYRKSYVERDVPAVVRIDDVPAFLRFLTACAATTARLFNVTDIARTSASPSTRRDAGWACSRRRTSRSAARPYGETSASDWSSLPSCFCGTPGSRRTSSTSSPGPTTSPTRSPARSSRPGCREPRRPRGDG